MLTDINSFFQHHRSQVPPAIITLCDVRNSHSVLDYQLGYIWTQYTDWADMPLKEGHRVDGWGKVASQNILRDAWS